MSDAPGKLVLLGEYAVLEGHDAVVTAVNRRASARATASATPRVWAKDLGIEGIPVAADPRLQWAASILGEAHVDVSFDTAEFFLHAGGPKLGLGSSAALVVALVAELHPGASVQTLFKLSLEAHAQAQHQLGSGVDVAASVYGGLLRYRIGPVVERLQWPKDLHMLAVWSGEPSSTPDMLRLLQQYKDRDAAGYHALMQQLGEISGFGCAALRQGDARQFCAAVERYHAALAQLGNAAGMPIVSPAHGRLAQLVGAQGGVYKPSGAGGGDLGVAFCSAAQIALDLQSAIRAQGYTVIPLTQDPQGVRTRG